jgi:glutamine cyclotransferase
MVLFIQNTAATEESIIRSKNNYMESEIQNLELRNLKNNECQEFSFDRLFNENSTQEEVLLNLHIDILRSKAFHSERFGWRKCVYICIWLNRLR